MNDFTDSWTSETWRKALRAAEDANFENVKTILRCLDEIERLATELERPWGNANRRRSAAAQGRRAQARVLGAPPLNWTVAQIMAQVKRSRRTVEGYLADD